MNSRGSPFPIACRRRSNKIPPSSDLPPYKSKAMR